MLKKLSGLVKKDKDLPERAHTIDALDQFRTGKIYDHLPFEFHQERDDDDKYIPMCERAPSVRFGLLSIIVKDSTSLLFGDSHFPAIDTGVKPDAEGKNPSNDALARIIKDSSLPKVMLDAAVRGSVGSVVVMLKVLKNRVFWEVMSTKFLTPVYKKDEPDTLELVIEKYKAKGRVFKGLGYSIDDKDLDRDFWFERHIGEQEELWYLPWPVIYTDADEKLGKYKVRLKDEGRSVVHNLGFNPCEWIENLPGGDGVDGAPTFPDMAIANAIEIDYLLSQNGRGLKYTADPTLLIKEPGYSDIGAQLIADPNGGQPKAAIVNGAADTLKVGDGGDAKMLEISGAGFGVVLEQVAKLRELTLELCGGARASPEKLAAAQSGKAMELMNQSLIWLASELRQTYGEKALISLVAKIATVNQRLPLRTKMGELIPAKTIKADAVSLKWPPWYAPTAADHQALATAIKTYRDAGVMQRKTGIRAIQHDFDIENVDDEASEIEREEKEAADAAQKLKAPASAATPPGARAAA
jgi:hypothetical protein